MAVRASYLPNLTDARRTPGPASNGPAAVLALAGCAVLAQVLDLVTFLRAVALYGVGVELNPVARTLFVHGGPAGVAAVKLAIAIVVPAALAFRARAGRHPALARMALVVAVAIGTLGCLSNLATICA